MVSFQQYPNGGLPKGFFPGLILGMKPHELRLRNLQAIIKDQFDGKAGRLADALGKKRPQIYRLFSNSDNRRDIGEELAREIEAKLGLPRGWLDQEPSSAQPGAISPTARDFVSTTERLASEGALTDNDMQMLRDLAERLANRKSGGA